MVMNLSVNWNGFNIEDAEFMNKNQIRIDTKKVNFSSLETEFDFRREAKKLLPEAFS